MVSDSWPLGWERVDFCPFNPPGCGICYAARGDECSQCADESPPFSRGPLASHTQTLLSGTCLCPASWSSHPRPTQNPQPLLPISARPPGKGWSPVVPTPTPGAFKSTRSTAPGPRCSADTALCPSAGSRPGPPPGPSSSVWGRRCHQHGLLSACSHAPNITWAVALTRVLPNREALPLEELPLAFYQVIKNLVSH